MIRTVIVVLALLSVVGCRDWPEESVALEMRVLELVNEAREAGRDCAGVDNPPRPAYQWNEELAWAARLHALDMAEQNYFEHDSLDVMQLLAQVSSETDLYVAQNIFFAVIAVTMIYAAFRVVTTANVVHAALWLVVVLAGVAVQFLFLGAEFVAVTQVLVYIGAVIVLFLFGVMLTRASMGDDETVAGEKRAMAAIVGVLLFAVMAMALVDSFEDTRVDIDQPQGVTEVSDAIFSQYIVPFEAVSVLLLAALIGAIVVARKD